MKLTYWIAECLDDSKTYSIRARTKREVAEALANLKPGSGRYGEPRKVTTTYASGFDLMEKCLCEDGGWWEDHQRNEDWEA